MEETNTTQERGHPDAHRSKLRLIMARIERELPESPVLRQAWDELGAALALGPEPATRTCPGCGGIGMRDATRCGHCWRSLPPASGAGA